MERRKYSRIPDPLPLTYRVITTVEYDERAALFFSVATKDRGPAGISALVHLLAAPSNPELIPVLTLLRTLHEKVDLLLALAGLPTAALALPKNGSEARPATVVDVSGNGLLMLAAEQLAPGVRIEIIMPAPNHSPFSIQMLATIVREGVKVQDRWKIPSTFTAMHGGDRDAMLGYVLHRTRVTN
jgi:hypothetical protein